MFNQKISDRHQFRASWHDYSDGLYFITICCRDRRHYFGRIDDGQMTLSSVGKIVEDCLLEIPEHFPNVEVWNHVVMPNHIHMAINVNPKASVSNVKPLNIGCLRPREHEPEDSQDFHHNSMLAVVINQFKSTVSRKVKSINPQFMWQKRYHEHIIRCCRVYERIMNYIDTNVENWVYDQFNNNRIDPAKAPWNVAADGAAEIH